MRKYYDELNLKFPYPDKQDGDRFNEDIEIYGFATKETWSLAETFVVWVYERFSMFRDVNNIALDRDKIIINGEEYIASDVLSEMINLSEELSGEDLYAWGNNKITLDKFNRLLLLFKESLLYWWW